MLSDFLFTVPPVTTYPTSKSTSQVISSSFQSSASSTPKSSSTQQPFTTTSSGPSSTISVSSCNIDLVFVIDSSYLIGWTNVYYWHQLLDFIVSMLDGMTILSTATQIGLIVIGWPSKNAFYLNNNWTKTELISNIQSMKYSSQWT